MLQTFEEVGASIGLSGLSLGRYNAYMLLRWAYRERELCSKNYSDFAKEWALRFREGSEYRESDCNGIITLQSIDGGDHDQEKIRTQETQESQD
jgi:hypothetical protein